MIKFDHDEIKFTIPGNPITKKNSGQIIHAKGRSIIIPSKQYKEYEKDFCLQCLINGTKDLGIDFPCNFEYHYFMGTKRKVDLTNLISATDDCLQTSGTIKDDDCTIVHSHDGCRVYYDKDNPRVEIIVSRINEDEIVFPNSYL